MDEVARQQVGKSGEESGVALEPRRELIEDRAKCPAQGPGPVEKARERLVAIPEPLKMSDQPAGLDRVDETLWRHLAPTLEDFEARQSVESRVDLDRVEVADIIAVPAALRQILRIEYPAPPAIVPAGGADMSASLRHVQRRPMLRSRRPSAGRPPYHPN